ncbi:Ribosomal_S9 domain-containing protein [Cephalotus follicularis]|uniref:Ribosomal_S9 domain-containing protein n=1 Tax=Cephalotus follicularis TaxID=3775 RepID=A0A1Q3B295_CEPFO|nr:Ribosomal_S9 domain-containing protein [Cephalotus follicularis]
MLSRLLPKPSHFRSLSNLSSKCPSYPHSLHRFPSLVRPFSDDNNRSTPEIWNFSRENDEKFDPLFGEEDSAAESRAGEEKHKLWSLAEEKERTVDDVFDIGGSLGDVGEATEAEKEKEEKDKPWSLAAAEEKKIDELFDIVESVGNVGEITSERIEEDKMLEKEEKDLTAILKGPNRAFGDLITASGITDEMLDSLIALKDFEGVEGLPPLSVIEDMRYEKNTRKSTRAEMERLKQEEFAKARVRQVDDKGRAYGTGRRKCSIARVWIQPGDGKFIVNDKQFDVYFPLLDHRAALLRPFSETKTLGLWDINCTVKGGGVSGQVGAIQLGVSRALQSWEPNLRSPLRTVGFLTRDPRVVERKKPGKAKARKSFQWVKR